MSLSLAANLGFLWPNLSLLERIDAAATAGFQAVEFHWPYELTACELATRCERRGLKIRGINTPRGETSKGEFGLAALTGREREFERQFDRTLDYALDCGASAIHVLAGVAQFNSHSRGVFLKNLRYAAERARTAPLVLLLEPLNAFDNPGYFYATVNEAVALIDELSLPNIKLQFDAYHVARAEGDVLTKLTQYFSYIGNIQIAGVPSRAEPNEGRFDYRELFAELVRLKYSGYIGCEYKPRGDTDAGLKWREELL